MPAPILQMIDIAKHFGHIIALSGVSFDVLPGECHCLLGDNGAGKSTFIKTMSGVHAPSRGEMKVAGETVHFTSPRAAMAAGIATVYQDLAMIPLMSVTRNFWMGREPEKGIWPFRTIDFAEPTPSPWRRCVNMGINLREPLQAVGTLSAVSATVAIAAQSISERRFSSWTSPLLRSACVRPLRAQHHRSGSEEGHWRRLHYPQRATRSCRRRPLHRSQSREDTRDRGPRSHLRRGAPEPHGRRTRTR